MSDLSSSDCVAEIIQALGANIEYLRQEGSASLTIRNGKLLNSIGDVFIYGFTLEFLQNIEQDADVEVRVRNQGANGRIIAIDDKNIQVELHKNLGQVIPEARLIISSYYLIQFLYDKFKKIESGELKLTDLAEKAFKLKPFISSSALDYQIPPLKSLNSRPLNPYQEAALRLALGSEVSFIWGPPGTGKTTTIARIIEGFISQDMSVLLASHTNVAVDGALEDVIEHLGTSDENYKAGKILRIAHEDVEKEIGSKYEWVIPKKVIEKKALPIIEEINNLSQKINDCYLLISKSAEVINIFEHLERTKKEKGSVAEIIRTKEQVVKNAISLITSIDSQRLTIDENIKKCQSSGFLKRLFSGLNLENLIQERVTLISQRAIEIEKIDNTNQDINLAKNRLREVTQEVNDIEVKLTGENFESAKKTVEQAQDSINKLTAQRDFTSKQLENLSIDLIKDAKVIATTLTKSYNSPIVLNREYDCVIIDEVSMAPLPALWCAAGLAKRKVVIIGDPYQLPPIAKHKVLRSKDRPEEDAKKEEMLIEKWLKKDIYQITKIYKDIATKDDIPELKQLRMQYRMHPHISGVVNKLIYSRNDKFALKNDITTENKGDKRLLSAPLEGFHVGIYDTNLINTVPCRTDNGSYYNLYHALISVELASRAISSGYESVGIISPFRAQVNLIRKILEDKKLESIIKVDTVHRYQGGERKLIIFDIPTSRSTKLIDDQALEGDDEKLLNVAFSRAEEKCIVIADVGRIKKSHSDTSLVKKFIDYCYSEEFPVISSENTLPQCKVAQDTEHWLKKINSIGDITKEISMSKIFDETDFYQNFTRDLLDAKKEVIIDSPFITAERARHLMPVLQHLRNKNINVFILTRQPKEHGDSMRYQAENEIRNFEDLGIVVLPFIGKIHRKLAIIDRHILWEGSLNILSQRDSQEVMRRFDGKATAEQMMKFLKLENNIGKIGENKLQRCESCNEPGSWYWTDKSIYGGSWTFCLIGGHKIGKLPKSDDEIKKIKQDMKKLRSSKKEKTPDGVPICPKHETQMVKRKSRYGEFWGCSKYPACRVIHKIGN